STGSRRPWITTPCRTTRSPADRSRPPPPASGPPTSHRRTTASPNCPAASRRCTPRWRRSRSTCCTAPAASRSAARPLPTKARPSSPLRRADPLAIDTTTTRTLVLKGGKGPGRGRIITDGPRRKKPWTSERIAPYLMVLPVILILLIFRVYPLLLG